MKRARWAGAVAAGILAAGCGGPHSGFAEPASEAAEAINALWWILFAVSLLVFCLVLAGWSYALLRRGGAARAAEPEGRSMTWILIGGVLVPGLILVGLTLATIRTSSRLAGETGAPNALLVEVVGHQFWWEARYPGTGVVTANEIHVPVGRAVRLRLTSNDVIHSLWVPRLHGKLDLTPGRATELVLRPSEPGIYRGFCAEFCGRQHALMGLRIVALPEVEFARWLERQAAPAASGAEAVREEGERLFQRYDCNLCHRIRGAAFPQPAQDVGPDLTHLASRSTLGAVTLDNTPRNLARWIRDPHSVKPGVRMPPTVLETTELRALVLYLGGLQ